MQLVLFNDAGFGADYAGIGDGRSTYADGIISAANGPALALGAVIGAPAKHFVDTIARR